MATHPQQCSPLHCVATVLLLHPKGHYTGYSFKKCRPYISGGSVHPDFQNRPCTLRLPFLTIKVGCCIFLRRWDYSAAVANAFCQLLLERQLLFWPQNFFISYPNQMIFVPKPYKTRCLQSCIQLEFASFRNVLITSLPGSNEASGAVSPVSFLGTLYNESMMIDLDIEYLP